MSDSFDVAIVGSGPAGVAAARLANQLGLSVVLIDEQRQLGGNIYRNHQRNVDEAPVLARVFGPEYLTASESMDTDFFEPGSLLLGAEVFAIDQGGEVSFRKDGQASSISASKVLIATGAMERPTPVPGWTLPGVMTVGAAQTLLKSAAIVPRGRSVVVGSGPLVLLLALQYLKLGAPPAAVVLTGPLFGVSTSFSAAASALRFPGRSLKGLAWSVRMLLSKTEVLTHASDVRINGEARATEVSFRSGAKTFTIPADNVFLHEGVVPSAVLAASANCELVWDETQMWWVPKLDEWGRTTSENIYIAGDGAEILGAVASAPSAMRAILSIATDLERIDPGHRDEQGRAPHEVLKKERGFRRFLDGLYPPPSSLGSDLPDETIVCRCESVTAGQIRDLSKLDCADINHAKAYTRCGMGPCQGRMCGASVAQIMAASQDRDVAEIGHFKSRTPIRPITLGELASFHTNEGFSILDMRK